MVNFKIFKLNKANKHKLIRFFHPNPSSVMQLTFDLGRIFICPKNYGTSGKNIFVNKIKSFKDNFL